jgi:hypothetical protein
MQKEVDLLGIEPRTFPMLRENYTTVALISRCRGMEEMWMSYLNHKP